MLLVNFSVTAARQDSNALPAVVITELKRLEETYRVLDIVSEKVWPGWRDYRQVPFLLEYENGLKILIGHPNPPKEFQLVPGIGVGGSQVYADRSQLVAKKVVPPLGAGGGPIDFGSTADGVSIRVVHMKYVPADQLDVGDGAAKLTSSEQQMLIYIHELFHCFQRSHIRSRFYGNLRYNPDAEYALYSEIEGLALHRAYQEPNARKSKQLIKEFLVARALKRAASMSDSQANQESSDEFIEGTATYAEIRTLEVLKSAGFVPTLSAQEDPAYSGFRNRDLLLGQYLHRLLKTSSDVEYAYGKSYTYGSFQALLADRLFPGWQRLAVAESAFIDKELGKRLTMSRQERLQIKQRIRDTYPVAEIRKRHAIYLEARDDAYRKMKGSVGTVYVIDFKATGQYLSTVTDKSGSYSLGLIQLYPNGLGPIKFDDVELSRITGLAEINQLYYVRTIDVGLQKDTEPLTIEGAKQADGSWKNAILRTPLFSLKAPHVRIKTIGRLVKIQVLSRTK